jgi:hypothetical protein
LYTIIPFFQLASFAELGFVCGKYRKWTAYREVAEEKLFDSETRFKHKQISSTVVPKAGAVCPTGLFQ